MDSVIAIGSLVGGNGMASEHAAEVWVRRYRDTLECDVIVAVRGQTMVLRCRNYSQAVKWAKIQCKTYGIPDFAVEVIATSQKARQAETAAHISEWLASPGLAAPK